MKKSILCFLAALQFTPRAGAISFNGGGGGGGGAVGGKVQNGTANCVLYLDSSGNLACDASNFFYSGSGSVSYTTYVGTGSTDPSLSTTRAAMNFVVNGSTWAMNTSSITLNGTPIAVPAGSTGNAQYYNAGAFGGSSAIGFGASSATIHAGIQIGSDGYFKVNSVSGLTFNTQNDLSNLLIIEGDGTGMIVGEKLMIGTIAIAQNKLDVEGAAVIGASYSGTNTAPANGLLVQGNVGIGLTSPGAPLHVLGADNGTVIISSIPAVQASITAADTFMSFNSNTGQEASVAGTAAAGVIAFNTFTGSHWTLVRAFSTEEDFFKNVFAPLCSTGERLKSKELWDSTSKQKVRIRVSDKEQLVNTEPCKQPYAKSIFGFYGGRNPQTGYDMALSLGTGMAWVLNTGTDVEQGDWLTTSGDGLTLQLQMVRGSEPVVKDDLHHNYSAAKSTQIIKWKRGETKRKVAVTYHAG